MPGYSGMRPRRLRPMIVGVPPRVGAAYAGIGRRNCGSRLLIHQMAFKPRVSGGFGVVEIGGISGACPRWVTDPAAEPAPPDHKRGVTETAPPSAAAGGTQVPPMRPVSVAYRVGTSPVTPLSIDIVLAAHTTHARLQWHTYDHWAKTLGAHPTISRHISVYPGISRILFFVRGHQGGRQSLRMRQPTSSGDSADASNDARC